MQSQKTPWFSNPTSFMHPSCLVVLDMIFMIIWYLWLYVDFLDQLIYNKLIFFCVTPEKSRFFFSFLCSSSPIFEVPLEAAEKVVETRSGGCRHSVFAIRVWAWSHSFLLDIDSKPQKDRFESFQIFPGFDDVFPNLSSFPRDFRVSFCGAQEWLRGYCCAALCGGVL